MPTIETNDAAAVGIGGCQRGQSFLKDGLVEWRTVTALCRAIRKPRGRLGTQFIRWYCLTSATFLLAVVPGCESPPPKAVSAERGPEPRFREQPADSATPRTGLAESDQEGTYLLEEEDGRWIICLRQTVTYP